MVQLSPYTVPKLVFSKFQNFYRSKIVGSYSIVVATLRQKKYCAEPHPPSCTEPCITQMLTTGRPERDVWLRI